MYRNLKLDYEIYFQTHVLLKIHKINKLFIEQGTSVFHLILRVIRKL